MSVLPAAELLFVEDHDDIRDALAEFLESEGYHVTAVANSTDALEWLGKKRFDAVMTDFVLPDHDGGWMLEEAQRRGLLHGSKALLITATPQAVQVKGVKVLPKPLDLNELIRELELLLGTGLEASPSTGPVVELVLYTAKNSSHSQRAVRNLRQILLRYEPKDVLLHVLDVADAPAEQMEHDRVLATPTLVRHQPTPRAWVLGDLSKPEVVERILEGTAVRRRGAP